MFYAVYNERGEIVQGNKVFEPEGYDERLHEMSYKFVKREGALLSADDWYVTAETLTTRPDMGIVVNKLVIKAGESDSSLFTNIPKKARVYITTGDVLLHDLNPLDASELDISIPVPCLYTVKFTLFPYKDVTFKIEAVS